MQYMKTISITTILISCCIFSIMGCSPVPGESTVSSTIVAKSLKETADKIGWSIDRAAANSDYLLEKNLRTLEVISNGIAHQFAEETAKNREFVSEKLSESVTRLNELVEQAQGGILEIEDFVVLDTQGFINQIPLKKDLFIVRRIKGYGVQYRESGEYDFEVVGNAFQPEYNYKIKIDDIDVDIGNIHSPIANTIIFTIPVAAINDKFLEGDLKRLTLQISSFKATGEQFSNFNGNILLLPKFPVKYRVAEKYKKEKWGPANKTMRFYRAMGPTGKNGVWHRHTLEGSVSDRNTQKFVKVVGIGTDGSHSWCKNPVFSDANRKISVSCANQCHDCTRNGWVEVSYQELTYDDDSQDIWFESDKNKKNLLTYDTHFARLNSNNQSWTIIINYFNGRKITLHPQKLQEKGIRAYVDSDQNSSFKQLIIEISDPIFG